MFGRIMKGSLIRVREDLSYHLSDFPFPQGTFDTVTKGDTTRILKVCSKIDGERYYIVSWSHDSRPTHIVRAHQIELVK